MLLINIWTKVIAVILNAILTTLNIDVFSFEEKTKIKNVDYLIFVKSFTAFRVYVAVYSYVTTKLFIFKSLSKYVCIYKSHQIDLHLLVFPDIFTFLRLSRYVRVSALHMCQYFSSVAIHIDWFWRRDEQ